MYTDEEYARRSSLLEGCMPMLQSYVRRLMHNQEAASDVLQEVSLRIWSSPAPDEADRFCAWCRGVARHVASGELRRRRRLERELTFTSDVLDTPDAIDVERDASLAEVFSQAAGGLDRDSLALFVRRYVLGEKPSDLASEMSRSPAAMRMQLMRLRSRFRQAAE